MLLYYIITCVDYLLLTGFAKLKLNSLKIKTLIINTNLKYKFKDIITVINKSDQKAKKYFLKKWSNWMTEYFDNRSPVVRTA